VRTRSDLIRLLDVSGIEYESLGSGRSWMIVCPALAARIMGAGIDEENAFWVPPAISTQGWGQGGNAGGQRTWIAPEGGPSGFFFSIDGARWDVPPELDPGRYRAAPAQAGWKSYRTALTARSADGSRREITLARSMSMEQETASTGIILHIRFRHELGNAGSTALEHTIGLWSLIQLPCEEQGVIFFAGGPALRRYFGELPMVSRDDAGRVTWMQVKGGTRFKAGMPPSDFAGTIGFVGRARVPENARGSYIITTMDWNVDAAGSFVDGPAGSDSGARRSGDASQAYCDAGTRHLAFCEIEAHAPAPLLAPGEADAQDIRISIARLEARDVRDYMSEKLEMEPLPRSALPV
jgi:hypothetical protein